MKTLSPKQQQIYDYIVSFSGLHGYPPSSTEYSRPGPFMPAGGKWGKAGKEACGFFPYAL